MFRSLEAVRRAICATGLAVAATVGAAAGGEGFDAAEAVDRASPSAPVDRQLRVSVDVRNQPLGSVVDVWSRQTGIAIHVYVDRERPVTASFRDVRVEKALQRLFGPDAQFAFRYTVSQQLAVPIEAWVWAPAPWPQRRGEPSSPAPAPPADTVTRRTEIRRMVQEPSVAAAPTLIGALRDGDAGVRHDAVAGLVRLRDDIVVGALEAVLTQEPEPELRATVAEILATRASPDALAALRYALADPEHLVRARAVAAPCINGLAKPTISSPTRRSSSHRPASWRPSAGSRAAWRTTSTTCSRL